MIALRLPLGVSESPVLPGFFYAPKEFRARFRALKAVGPEGSFLHSSGRAGCGDRTAVAGVTWEASLDGDATHHNPVVSGIAVPDTEEEQVLDRIRTYGLDGTEGRWILPLNRNRANPGLLTKTDLSIADTRRRADERLTVCACGDEAGAAFYSTKHEARAGTVPITIEIEAMVDRVWVDGRDFLYTAFQHFDQRGTHNLVNQRQLLEKCFGRAILPYFDRAAAVDETSYRIAICDLAIEDPEVIVQHSRNGTLLQGRHNTRFRSAFAIELPVTPGQITAVRRSSVPAHERPAVTLEKFLTGEFSKV